MADTRKETSVRRTFSILPIVLQLLIHTSLVTAQETPRPPAASDPAPAGNQKQAAGAASQVGDKGFTPQVVPVNVLPPSELIKLLAPLVTPGGAVLDQPGGKSLMIVDSPSNIQNLMEIKDSIDVPAFAGARIEIFQPKLASAQELAAGITKAMRIYIFSAAEIAGLSAEFVPLPRVNQLLVISHSESAWTFAQRWLERIDGFAGPARRIFVYPVEQGKAVELVEKLNQVKISTQRQPRIVTDSVTSSPIIYGTAQEFQEIKNALNSRQVEEFKQRLLALRREIELIRKKSAPAG